jgi:hypothetical protein
MIKFLAAALALACAAAAQQQPDLEKQRQAMKKLEFLAGKWSGDATVQRGPGQPIKVRQSESVEYKLDGLALLVEGAGRDPASGKVVFTALAVISYDDAAGVYRFRAYNEGRYLDTELKVGDSSFEWTRQAGPASVKYTMRLDSEGSWVETGDVTVGSAPPRRVVDMHLKRER